MGLRLPITDPGGHTGQSWMSTGLKLDRSTGVDFPADTGNRALFTGAPDARFLAPVSAWGTGESLTR